MSEVKKRLKAQIIQSLVMVVTAMAIITTTFAVKTFAQEAHGDEPKKELSSDHQVPKEGMTSEQAEVTKFGFIAAAVAFGLGAIGAGFAISHVGAAAMGAVAEKPEIAGQALIFVALAEGLVVFGFITALMILGKI